MKLTPMDIKNKEFKKAIRGYAADEVDEFMEEIPQSFVLINNIVTELTQPKSKKNLEKPLENQPKE